jgi:hypothetical protein
MNRRHFSLVIHTLMMLLWIGLMLPVAIIIFGMGGGWSAMSPSSIIDYVKEFGPNEVLAIWLFKWSLFLFPIIYFLALATFRKIRDVRTADQFRLP